MLLTTTKPCAISTLLVKRYTAAKSATTTITR